MKRYFDSTSRLTFFGTIFMLAVLILSGCNLPQGSSSPTKAPELVFPTAIPSAAPNLVTATLENSKPAPTNTTAPVPPTAVPPTAVPPTAVPPTAAPAATAIVPSPVRINFATGATTGIVENTIQTGQIQNYLVGASKDQPLLISIDCLNHDVIFSVVGLSDGKTLLHQADNTSSWQTMLTVTQDYLIRVYGGGSNEKYNLNVSTPARVNFASGAISATRNGTTPGGFNVAYALRANANQQMDLVLNAPAGAAVLSVYGYQDGNPYLRSVVEQTTFSLKLPATQDFIIQVVPRAGQQTDYSITFTIK